MPCSLRALRLFPFVLVVGALTSACASNRVSGTGSTAQDEAAEDFDEALFLTDCRQGCRDEPAMCEAFCTCSADRIQASPELARAVERAESGTEDAAVALDFVQGQLIGACGAELYQHHFVRGCAATCVEEGATEAVCSEQCGCLYAALRERHPGNDGLADLARAFGAPELPDAVASEIEAARPACGF